MRSPAPPAPPAPQGVLELEQFLPSRLLNPRIHAPQRPTRLDYYGRKEAAVQRDLLAINTLLDASKVRNPPRALFSRKSCFS